MTTMPFSKLHLADKGFANPRTSSGLDDEGLRELALHIARHGLLTPLLVRSDGLVLGGQRRYRALEMLFVYVGDGPEEFEGRLGDEVDEWPAIENMSMGLQEAIPVRVVEDHIVDLDEDGIALADNILREGLSSYELASAVGRLTDQGVVSSEVARRLGKSRSWVSRKLNAWRGAGDTLKAMWMAGKLTDDQVFHLASLSVKQQEYELADNTGRPTRGAASRPGIDAVKDVLLELEKRPHDPSRDTLDIAYTSGVADALRWVAGHRTTEEFAKLVEEDQ